MVLQMELWGLKGPPHLISQYTHHHDIMSGGSPLEIHGTSLDFPYTHYDIKSGGSPPESMEHPWISCTLIMIPSSEDPL